MGITDWDKWMKEHHIYIPTEKEIEDAKRRKQTKVSKLSGKNSAINEGDRNN